MREIIFFFGFNGYICFCAGCAKRNATTNFTFWNPIFFRITFDVTLVSRLTPFCVPRFSFVCHSTENIGNLMMYFNPFPNDLILWDFCLHRIQYIRYNYSFVQSYHLQLELINNKILILNFIVICMIIYYLIII